MSTPTYDLSELSNDALIDIINRLQHNASQQNENILVRRNRLLTEENDNFRKQIDELNSFRMQYYNLKSSMDHYDQNILELKNMNNQLQNENIKLNEELASTKQFQTNYNETQNAMNQLKSENESLHKELENHKMAYNQYNETQNNFQELTFKLNQLKTENKNLQVLLCGKHRNFMCFFLFLK